MKIEAEQHLWTALAAQPRRTPRVIIAEMLETDMIADERQALATLGKWAGEGCYDYGVCIDLGWSVPGKQPRRWAKSA